MEQLFIQNEKELIMAHAIIAELLKVGPVDLQYRPHKRSKSMEQLGYYYGCVLPLLQKRLKKDGNDFSIDRIDAFLKTRLFTETLFNPLSGEMEKIVKMKRNATVLEMSEYLQLVIDFCQTELGMKIPAAEDYIILKEIGL
jgi:hypothetical protein